MGDSEELCRAKIFNDTKWMYYCLCQGWGIGSFSPLVAADVKELCIHTTCSTATIGGDDGLCNATANMLCITEHFALPPAKGTYPCICFNKKIGDERASGTVAKGNLFDMKQVMEETFWIYYVFCGGWGFNKMKGPWIASQFKELCCEGSTSMVSPIDEGILCSSVATELCIWSEFQIPPAGNNPKCALCTWKLNKNTAEADTKIASLPPRTKKPQQQGM